MFPPSGLVSPEHVLLITDELPSPADFILHQILSSQLKNTSCRKCVLLSASDDLGRWKAVAAKSKLNLTQYMNDGSFVFVDVSSRVESPTTKEGYSNTSLRPVYDALPDLIGGGWDGAEDEKRTLVILDEISLLHWIGFPTLELVRFSRAVRAMCLKMNACFIVRHHVVTYPDPDDLLQHFLQICTYHIDVRSLASGRSGAVSGEIALHAGPSIFDIKAIPLIPRSAAIQYRLTDGGAIFFERGGTSSGVL